jgi:hypothetical protein
MALRSVRLQTAQITRTGQVAGNFRACTQKLFPSAENRALAKSLADDA